MYKSTIALSLFLIGSLLMAPVITLNVNLIPNVIAQEYHNYNNYEDNNYSESPNKVNKYECQRGLFEGFFVSSPEFCVLEEEYPKKEKQPPVVQTETLTVVKNTECQADPAICEQNPIQPSQFTIVIEEGNNNPSQTTFPGVSTPGTDIELKPGPFSVSEHGLDPTTPEICTTMGFDAGREVSSSASDIAENLFICTNFSEECEGEITIGNNPETCTIDNVLVQQQDDDNLNLDLAVANAGSQDVSILLGNGDGTFGTADNFPVGTQPRSVAVGLFNGDTFQDLAVANIDSNDVSILLGNGDGTFGTADNFLVGTEPNSVAVGLFNGDTFQDLAVANIFSSDVSILLGNGDGTFDAATNFAAGLGPRSVAVGLFNADTFLDLAVANGFSDDVSILLGNGDGTFDAATNFGAGEFPFSIAVGDFNGDTFQDLAVVNHSDDTIPFPGDVSILLGNGDGTFDAATNFAAGDQPSSVAVGLFNGDTFQDLAVANAASDDVSILLGNGDGTFDAPADFAAGESPFSIAVGLFNGDPFLDLAVANIDSNDVSILLGNGDGTFDAATNFAAGTNPFSIAVGEFDGS